MRRTTFTRELEQDKHMGCKNGAERIRGSNALRHWHLEFGSRRFLKMVMTALFQ